MWALALLGAAWADGAVMRVALTGMRTDSGRVVVALYEQPAGYPLDLGKAARLARASVQGGAATVEFSGLPFGTYALAAIHDEDGDGTLDTNWIGIPSEGVASSNNAKGRFGPPRFEDAAFAFSADGQVAPMRMAYIGD